MQVTVRAEGSLEPQGSLLELVFLAEPELEAATVPSLGRELLPSLDAEGLEMALSELSDYMALFHLCRLGRGKGAPRAELLPSVISTAGAYRPGLGSRGLGWTPFSQRSWSAAEWL